MSDTSGKKSLKPKKKLKFHINRSHNTVEYLQKHKWEKADLDEESDFSLWDTYQDAPIQSKIMVWPKAGLSQIVDCLWTWHSRLEKLRLTHLAPETILQWREKELTEADFADGKFWFLKDIFGVHGKGINIISTLEDYHQFIKANKQPPVREFQGPCSLEYLKDRFVLQKCETDTHLIRKPGEKPDMGRKYILRVYSLTMGNGETYLYNDCLYYSALFPLKYDNQDCYVDNPPSAEELKAVRTELETMKVKALKQRAKEVGVEEGKLDDADVADDVKGTVIHLILGQMRKENPVHPLSVKNKSGKTFVPKEQMRKNVHVSHWKKDTEEYPFGIGDDRLMGLLSRLPNAKALEIAKIQRNLFDSIASMSLLYNDILTEHKKCEKKPEGTEQFSHDKKTYQIWGADYIVLSDLSVKCLEINAFPCLTHGKRGEGEEDRPHELDFRRDGFDRGLMGLFGFDFDEKGQAPHNWELVNGEAGAEPEPAPEPEPQSKPSPSKAPQEKKKPKHTKPKKKPKQKSKGEKPKKKPKRTSKKPKSRRRR